MLSHIARVALQPCTMCISTQEELLCNSSTIVGDFNAEGPPVPIPNTEVKLCSGDNTCLETDREDSSLPTNIAFNLVVVVSYSGDIGRIYK